MSNEHIFLEGRKHKRFRLKKGVHAALTPGNKIGQIKEINEGGLVFRCADNDKPLKRPVKIDIFSSAYDFYLSNVPVQSSGYLKTDSKVSLSSQPIRQLKIQIGKMTSTQIILLDHFLKEYILPDS